MTDSFDPIQLDTSQALSVTGVLQPTSGGTGREDGKATGGVVRRMQLAESSASPYGTLVALYDGTVKVTTTTGQTDVIGAIADYEIEAYDSGFIVVAGVADVILASAVDAGDRVRSSSTAGAAESGDDGSFGVAIGKGTTGDIIPVLLDRPLRDGELDHGGLQGLSDDDHPNYLLRREIRRGPDRVTGLTPTGVTDTGAWSDLANVTDGDTATYASLSSGTPSAGTLYTGFRWDLTTAKVLSLLTMRVWVAGGDPNSGSGIWGYSVRVRYSDDNSTWTTLDTQNPVWTNVGSDVYTMATTFLQTAARYWEATLVKVHAGGFSDAIRVHEVTWQEDTSDGHTLQSDQHRDVATTAPSDGQILTWDSTSKTWGPEDAPGTTSTGRVYVVIDGGGDDIVVSPAPEVDIVMPVTGTFTEWVILGDAVGSAELDLWLDTYANYPPTVGDSIVDGNYPTLSSQSKNADTDLSDWTTVAFSEGDVLRAHLNSATGLTRLSFALKFERT